MKLDEKEVQELKDKKVSIEDLNEKYFVEHLNEPPDDHWGFWEPYSHSELEFENVLKLLNNEICSFKKVVDRVKNIQGPYSKCLDVLLKNNKLFKELRQNNKLNKEDLKYLLNTIDDWYDLNDLCKNTPLIRYILNEFVLDKKLVDRLNTMIENSDWCKNHNIPTIFDWIEHEYKHNEEILKLNELSRLIYSFDLNEDQRNELSEVLRDNEQSQNTLIQIVENHLEDQYDFEQLKRVLTKNNDKNLKTKFNF